MKTLIATLALSAILGAAGQAAAGTTIYDTSTATPGNQDWTGTLGLDFTVNSAVVVNALGAFDASADGFGDAIHVTIFDSHGVEVTSVADFTGANPGHSAYVFQAITPTLLAPGNYQIAAWGYGSAENNYNNGAPGGPITFNNLGGALTAVSSHYSDRDAPGVFATNTDNGSTRYGAGSFQASLAVPEPAAWALMLVGFGGLGAVLRRRRSIAALPA